MSSSFDFSTQGASARVYSFGSSVQRESTPTFAFGSSSPQRKSFPIESLSPTASSHNTATTPSVFAFGSGSQAAVQMPSPPARTILTPRKVSRGFPEASANSPKTPQHSPKAATRPGVYRHPIALYQHDGATSPIKEAAPQVRIVSKSTDTSTDSRVPSGSSYRTATSNGSRSTPEAPEPAVPKKISRQEERAAARLERKQKGITISKKEIAQLRRAAEAELAKVPKLAQPTSKSKRQKAKVEKEKVEPEHGADKTAVAVATPLPATAIEQSPSPLLEEKLGLQQLDLIEEELSDVVADAVQEKLPTDQAKEDVLLEQPGSKEEQLQLDVATEDIEAVAEEPHTIEQAQATEDSQVAEEAPNDQKVAKSLNQIHCGPELEALIRQRIKQASWDPAVLEKERLERVQAEKQAVVDAWKLKRAARIAKEAALVADNTKSTTEVDVVSDDVNRSIEIEEPVLETEQLYVVAAGPAAEGQEPAVNIIEPRYEETTASTEEPPSSTDETAAEVQHSATEANRTEVEVDRPMSPMHWAFCPGCEKCCGDTQSTISTADDVGDLEDCTRVPKHSETPPAEENTQEADESSSAGPEVEELAEVIADIPIVRGREKVKKIFKKAFGKISRTRIIDESAGAAPDALGVRRRDKVKKVFTKAFKAASGVLKQRDPVDVCYASADSQVKSLWASTNHKDSRHKQKSPRDSIDVPGPDLDFASLYWSIGII
ncbi:hypothetical protein BT63DRAFT_39604 [Microthyrium microscopicum]|uniref:Uncharacterized protein n=1 Tax=Microthyrium microscopicum TaxID=703497 RepID=A0A6A6UVQ1_9PEZI|nr:hypothetical protein BT63DRAFT_39604 [Microthyrium microscopicum]